MPVSGFTHLDNSNAKNITWSAYRYPNHTHTHTRSLHPLTPPGPSYSFHDMDPLPFENGFRLVWRNGDMTDPVSGHKCFTESGGHLAGNPTTSTVTAYGWVYTWD